MPLYFINSLLCCREKKRLQEDAQRMNAELNAVKLIAEDAQQAAHAAVRGMQDQRKDLDIMLSRLSVYEQLPAVSQVTLQPSDQCLSDGQIRLIAIRPAHQAFLQGSAK